MKPIGDWCLIESDPGIFTELIKKFGTRGLQVDEMWSMDDDIFESLRPVHGLIFLFKYVHDEEPSGVVVRDNRLEKIYFAKQVINNACATQAVISILLNSQHPHIILGPELTKLKEFSMSFDPKMRGLALSNSQYIREAHNSMAPQTFLECKSRMPSKEEDSFHFVSYMPISGRLYELDGLKEGPIDHGPVLTPEDWLQDIRPIIMRRINRYTEGEIHFNLMALVSDRIMLYEMEFHNLLSGNHTLNRDQLAQTWGRIASEREAEERKRARYEREMIRRKHNYVPFLVELLKILGEQKKLIPLFEKAKYRATHRTTKRMKL